MPGLGARRGGCRGAGEEECDREDRDGCDEPGKSGRDGKGKWNRAAIVADYAGTSQDGSEKTGEEAYGKRHGQLSAPDAECGQAEAERRAAAYEKRAAQSNDGERNEPTRRREFLGRVKVAHLKCGGSAEEEQDGEGETDEGPDVGLATTHGRQ